MKTYIALGSNLGDRRAQLEAACDAVLKKCEAKKGRLSPVYETPALLPPGADSAWNLPFLNAVLEIETRFNPGPLLAELQEIERSLGRQRHSRWAPREIDLDIIAMGALRVEEPHLRIPHPEATRRSFVLDPLKDLNPKLCLPGTTQTVAELARTMPQRSPLWMGILNLTPDSFSDGGSWADSARWKPKIEELVAQNIAILDVGGESTRPGAEGVDAETEWTRVQPFLAHFRESFGNRLVRPRLSLDTRHRSTALRALEYGVDILNDVSALADPRFADLAKEHGCRYVLTHSLSVPADPTRVLRQEADVLRELREWFSVKIATLLDRGLREEQIILDPGIGFGKTALQSQIILQGVEDLFALGLPLLLGHSRKGFMKNYAPENPAERDWESVGISMALAQKGVDIVRVHEASQHIRAFRAFNHVRKAL